MTTPLGHEKLRVYQRALRFASWVHNTIAAIGRRAAVEHLDGASESIVENIAIGNSRREAGDRKRYFEIAMGSGLESAACLDICCCLGLIGSETQIRGKEQLVQIVRMLVGMRGYLDGQAQEGKTKRKMRS